jgi:sterol 3beta-glucosyltransferase
MSRQSSSADGTFTNGSPALPRLFSDASLYKTFLNEHGSDRSGNSKDKNEVVKGFTELVAVDLDADSPEKAIAGRLAKLAVTEDSWLDAEPESSGSDSDVTEESSQDDSKNEEGRPLTSSASRSSTVDGEALKLAPDEIVNLLIQEFGPLAAEGEEEKLILEADSAWIHDVVILVRVYGFA